MAQGEHSCLKDTSFKTTDELRSLREEKGTRSPEMLKVSAANQLYYRASPVDDVNVESVLLYLEEFAREKESKNRLWITKGLEKYTKCGHQRITEPVKETPKTVEKIRPRADEDLIAAFRQDSGSSRLTYVDDIAMENFLRRKADEVKEKMRITKYKQHMNQFMKVYKILKGGNMDYSGALDLINKGGVREAYLYGMKGSEETSSFWELSRHSFPVKMETFSVNRRRLLRELASYRFTRAVVLLKGGEDIYEFDSNEKYTFRQEPFFLWTFGATEPNLWGCLDCWTGKAVLFVQMSLDEDGESSSSSYLALLKAKYEVDHVTYIENLQDTINNMHPTAVLILNGVNPDSGRAFPKLNESDFALNACVDDTTLYDVMCNLRSIKTNFELDLIRYASNVSSLGHRVLMKRITADCYEYQAEALFKFFVHFVGNCHTLSYAPVCASGSNTSDPEYRKNSRLIKSGDLIIFDMGASYHGYCSAIACTIPSSGMFDLEQKTIYNIVLETRKAALDVIKSGVFWAEVHNHSMRVLLSMLKQTGILNGDVEEMLHEGISTLFMPFGIGHFIGLNKFDVGSTFDEVGSETPPEVHCTNLRTHRSLKHGMVMVVQVGCYFNHPALKKACTDLSQKKFIVKEKISRFTSLGGVFLKENIVVTHQGYELLTDVPRTVEDVENWIAGVHNETNTSFADKEKSVKDEIWLGAKGNPCDGTDAQHLT